MGERGQVELVEDLGFLGEEVELGKIEARLRELGEEDVSNTWASLQNFAIFSRRGEGHSLEENHGLLGEILEEHAARGLLMHARPEVSPPAVRAWVTGRCHLGGGQGVVCSEQVSFVVEGHGRRAFQNLLFGHLDSDLPLALWWQGVPDDGLDEHLAAAVDRLIVDSSGWRAPLESLRTVEGLRRAGGGRFVLHDLAWTRGHVHRLALAQAMDQPVGREVLEGALVVRIEQGAGAKLEGTYLFEWLAGGLGWERLGEGEAKRADGGVVRMARVIDEAGSRELGRVEIEDGRGRVVSVVRSATCGRLELVLPGGHLGGSLPCGMPGEADLVREILRRGGRNRLFEGVLARVGGA